MKTANIALGLGVLLLTLGSSQPATIESPWLAFSCRGGLEDCQPLSISQQVPMASAPEMPKEIAIAEDGTTLALKDGVLTVLHQGEEVWSSDPSWDVRQLLVGDVNNDGKQEVALVLWKLFRLEPRIIYDTFGFPSLWEEGSLRNHLFIYGWRDAAWRHLWCSSPVADPIVELAAADVDGDGANELVVLEGSYETHDNPGRHVSMWRWNGWGFTLQWRSPGGVWDRLILQDVTDDDVPDILVKEPN
jgi:hypothetical protein